MISSTLTSTVAPWSLPVTLCERYWTLVQYVLVTVSQPARPGDNNVAPPPRLMMLCLGIGGRSAPPQISLCVAGVLFTDAKTLTIGD
jgi:hypothetical protein